MIRVFEAFSGIGTQRMALERLNLPHQVVGISEIDKYALKSYEAIHGDCPNVGDISKLDPQDLPDFDLFTYSFPCQDLSIAGKQKGLVKGQTRSGLLYECEKIIEGKRPRFLLMENVKHLVSQKFKPQFEEWLTYLESLGYTNYWQVLNAKDYGVPQHRERIFVVSILNHQTPFTFPPAQPLTKTLSDVMDETIPFDSTPWHFTAIPKELKKTSQILTAKGEQWVRVRTYPVDVEALKQCLKTAKQQTKLTIRMISTQLGVEKTTVDHWFRQDACFSIPDPSIWFELKALLQIETDAFDVPITHFTTKLNAFDISNRLYHVNGIAPTLTCCGVTTAKRVFKGDGEHGPFEVRHLTSREYWRLMGVSDEAYQRAKQSGVSEAQLYKQAGNAIVVDVLEAIFRALFLLN